MLSIGELRPGQEHYYLEAATKGIDEYYTVRGEIAGRWVGDGAQDFGLGWRVESDELRAILDGDDPRTRRHLASRTRRVPGFDACFSAPKSVSMLFALGEDNIGAQVFAAHDAAAVAALGYLECHAVFVRRGHAGARRVRAQGLVGAAFRHRTSRAGDPQLHTHVLIANLTRGADGRWGTLDSRCLFRHARSAGFVYQAQLRHELSRRLGVRWGPVLKGCAEIEGVPATVLRAFSQRRDQITKRLDERGQPSAAAAQVATLATRSAKDYDEDHRALRAEWIARAEDLGFDAADVAACLDLEPEPVLEQPDHAEVAAELTAEHATFLTRDVVRVFAGHAHAGTPIETIEHWTSQFLASEHAVQLRDDRYSTPEMLRLEQAIVTHAIFRRGDHIGIAPDETVDAALRGRWRLSREQRAMIRRLTTTGAGVDVVVGVAGAGKTVALEVAREAWETSGHRVIGTALAARAAARLQEGAGITSHTLDALLRDLESPQTALPQRSVIVVDEAGMVGTRKLARLLTRADQADAKVVLVGDHHQLPEIGAGGAYRGLADRLCAFELNFNLRQRDPVEREALANLRGGEISVAIRQLGATGHVTVADTANDVRAAMVRDWLDARDAGWDTIMLAARRRDVSDLNTAARAELVARGDVHPNGLDIAGRTFATGDRVMALSNRKHIDVLNGDRGTVTAIDQDQAAVTVDFDRGHRVKLPASYVRARHLNYAYATTIHKAQGLTCHHTLLFADDGIFQEAGYTALTRGALSNHLYVVHPERPDDPSGHGPQPEPRSAVDELTAALERSSSKTMAIDDMRRRMLEPRAPEPPGPALGLELSP